MGGGGACSAPARPGRVSTSNTQNPRPARARPRAPIRGMLGPIMVRRLPVLQNQDTDDAAAARRPRWQWVLIGAGLVITLFLPLSWIGVWLGAWLSGAASRGAGGAIPIVLGVLPVAFS